MISEYTADPSKLIQLEKMKELSLNVKNEDGLKLYLKEGTAEIFGRELPPLKMQHFQKGDRFTIFTWTGCTLWLEYQNNEDFFPITEESQYPVYAMINQYLNELRTQAQDKRKIGPRVLICGTNQSGKTTVTKTLMNYGCKQGWTPVLVDLDPMQNSIMAGGCIGACVCKDFYPTNSIELKNKLVLYHGYSRVQMGLLKNQIEMLGQSITKKLTHDLEQSILKYSDTNLAFSREDNSNASAGNASNPNSNLKSSKLGRKMMLSSEQAKEIFSSGCLINMPAMQSKEQKEMIDIIVKNFNVDVILGLDDELCNSLKQNLLLTNGFSVIRTPKPCGLKNKEEQEQIEESRKINQKLFQQYFKGLNNDIDCHNQEVSLNELLVYRLKTDKNQLHQTKHFFEKVDLQKENSTKSILGVLNLPRTSLDKLKEEEIFEKISKSTLGILVHLSDMRTNQQYARLFLPGLNMEQFIKENVCVIGDITWFEQSGDKKKL